MVITDAAQLVAGRSYKVRPGKEPVEAIPVEGARMLVEVAKGTVLEYEKALADDYHLFKVRTGNYAGGAVEIHRARLEGNLEEEE